MSSSARGLLRGRAEEFDHPTMTNLFRSFAAATALSLASFSATAHADPITFVDGHFADNVEAGHPVGDGTGAMGVRRATYYFTIANPGAPVQVSVVWKVDGHAVGTERLDIGTTAHFHTWVHRPRHGGQAFTVDVLGPDGTVLHSDTLGAHTP